MLRKGALDERDVVVGVAGQTSRTSRMLRTEALQILGPDPLDDALAGDCKISSIHDGSRTFRVPVVVAVRLEALGPRSALGALEHAVHLIATGDVDEERDVALVQADEAE